MSAFVNTAISSASAKVRAAVAPVEHLLNSTDADIAWALTRVACAIGSPHARCAPDPAEVREAVSLALLVSSAKSTRYYRIGDSTWTLYLLLAVWPGVVDKALMMPVPPKGLSYSFDPSVPIARLDGKDVAWPLIEPPPISLLASSDPSERNASGFVPEALAQPGAAALPAAVNWKGVS